MPSTQGVEQILTEGYSGFGLEELDREQLRRELREACKTDLIFLSHDILGYPDVDTPLHRDLARFLLSPGKSKAVFLPRKNFKTTVGTVSLTIQKILNDPARKMLIAMATLGRAIEVLREIGYHLQYNPKLQYLFPELFSSDILKVTQKEIIIGRGRKEATISVGSADGNLVSAHYDDIFYDDLVDMLNSATLTLCKKTLSWYRASHSLSSFTFQEYVYGTPWAPKDMYAWIRKEARDQFQIYERPAAEPPNLDDGVPIFPEKFSLEELKKERARLGSYYFSLQYFLEMISKEDAIFKMGEDGDIKYYTDLPKNLNRFMTIDAALSLEEGSNWSVVLTCGVDSEDNIYVINYRRGHWLPDKLIDIIFEEHQRYKPLKSGMEKVVFQDVLMFDFKKEQMRKKIFFPMVELKADRKHTKERRILALQPIHEAGKLFIRKDMIELEDEMMRFRTPPQAGVPDDILDALAFQLQLAWKPRSGRAVEDENKLTMGNIRKKLKEAKRLRGLMGNENLSFEKIWKYIS